MKLFLNGLLNGAGFAAGVALVIAISGWWVDYKAQPAASQWQETE